MHYSVGVGYQATYKISDDATKNGFDLIKDQDKQDAKPEKVPEAFKWMRRSGFLDMLWYWHAFDLGMGVGFAIPHWNKELKDIALIDDVQRGRVKKKFSNRRDFRHLREAPPTTPPDRWEVLNPRYFQPTGTSLTKSKRLNYDEEVWEFNGGVVRHATKIHRDRVFVLRTHEMTGYWRGLSTFDPIRFSLLGYFNNLIFVQRGVQNWGDNVATLFYGHKFPTIEEQKKIQAILDLYEANGKIHLPEGAKLDFKQVNIGKGLRDAMEMYVEDISGKLRIGKNQLLGRSEGGGLTSGPAQITKDDYYERVGDDQRKLSRPTMKILWRFFPETEDMWPRWHLNVYKTDEQRHKEEGMKLDNEKKKWEVKILKQDYNMKKEQRAIAMIASLQGQPLGGNGSVTPSSGNGNVQESRQPRQVNSEVPNAKQVKLDDEKETKQDCLVRHENDGKSKKQAEFFCRNKEDFMIINKDVFKKYQFWLENHVEKDLYLHELLNGGNGDAK
jgi:hypothetical protein